MDLLDLVLGFSRINQTYCYHLWITGVFLSGGGDKERGQETFFADVIMVADLDCGPFYMPQDFQPEFLVMHTPPPRRFSF